jgi:hypothetical protein
MGSQGMMMGGMGGLMGAMMGAPGAGGGFGGAGGSMAYSVPTLAELIATTITPESWSVNGGTGTLVEYDGLLVVNQNPVQHARIVKLLKMLRAAKTARPDRDYPAIIKGQPVAN